MDIITDEFAVGKSHTRRKSRKYLGSRRQQRTQDMITLIWVFRSPRVCIAEKHLGTLATVSKSN